MIALFSALVAAAAGPVDGSTLVSVELVSDTAQLTPGQTATLGARFRVAEGWHIYWTNPGDSGLATEVALTGPGGVSLGEARYPGPDRFALPGDIVNYGYEGEVTLLVPITAPREIGPGGTVEVTGEASWLVCRESCLRGEAAVSKALRVAAPGTAPAPGDGAEAIAAARRRLPTPVEASPGATTGVEGRTLKVRLPASRDAAFFPSLALEDALASAALRQDGEATLLTLTLAADAARAEPLTGVLKVTRADGPRWYTITAP